MVRVDEGRVVVSTHDRREAPELLRRAFPSLVLTVPPSDGPFVFRQSAIGDARIRSTELMLSGEAQATGSLPEGVVAVGQVLGGRFSAEYARTRVDPRQPFLLPMAPARFHLHDAHLRVVAFDAEAFHAAAERHDEEAGGRRRRLSRTAPMSDAAASAWRWTAAHIQNTVRDPSAFDNPIVAAELFDLGVRTVLACFAEPAAEDRFADVRSSPHAVRRAVAYLEEHAMDSVSVPDVAAAARVSVRSLQAMFRRHLGVSPVEHLHAIRLESARRDLLTAEAIDTGLIGTVAERWGFGNSGRFARLYSERFRERPSDTLRARR